MRASRLLSILILLQLRGRMTAEALAEEFEVSVRTIYRDLEDLGAAGIPVRGEPGPGGGFALVDGYRTRLTGLGSDEAQAIFMIGLPGPAAALGLGGAAARAEGKLLAALSPSLGAEARRVAARFHLDALDWYRAAESTPHLPALARAVLDARAVEMTYESWTTTRDRRAEPLGLVLKAGAWYAVARAGGAPRIFRVSKIRALRVQGDVFERPAEFDLPRWWEAELARFETELRRDVATLRASPLGRERLARLGAFAAQAVASADAPDPDGWARVRLPIETLEHAALLLLGVGPELEVLEPSALRAQVRALAERVASRAR